MAAKKTKQKTTKKGPVKTKTIEKPKQWRRNSTTTPKGWKKEAPGPTTDEERVVKELITKVKRLDKRILKDGKKLREDLVSALELEAPKADSYENKKPVLVQINEERTRLNKQLSDLTTKVTGKINAIYGTTPVVKSPVKMTQPKSAVEKMIRENEILTNTIAQLEAAHEHLKTII